MLTEGDDQPIEGAMNVQGQQDKYCYWSIARWRNHMIPQDFANSSSQCSV